MVGVEAALYPPVYRRLRGLPAMAGGPTIAEGIAVKEPGSLTYPIIERLVDDVMVVDLGGQPVGTDGSCNPPWVDGVCNPPCVDGVCVPEGICNPP